VLLYSKLQCLLIQPLYITAPVTDKIQARQGRTCNLPHSIRKLQCRNKQPASTIASADAKKAAIAQWVYSNRLSYFDPRY
jgi:hypothetical protein